MVVPMDEYRNEGRCEDCDRWSSHLRDGLCVGCQQHQRNRLTRIYTIAEAARRAEQAFDPDPDPTPPAA